MDWVLYPIPVSRLKSIMGRYNRLVNMFVYCLSKFDHSDVEADNIELFIDVKEGMCTLVDLINALIVSIRPSIYVLIGSISDGDRVYRDLIYTITAIDEFDMHVIDDKIAVLGRQMMELTCNADLDDHMSEVLVGIERSIANKKELSLTFICYTTKLHLVTIVIFINACIEVYYMPNGRDMRSKKEVVELLRPQVLSVLGEINKDIVRGSI